MADNPEPVVVETAAVNITDAKPADAHTEGMGGEDKQEKMNNVLMISSRKPRGFYERAAKELFASEDKIVKVSALGDAIALAVELANTLEQKKDAKIVKVETKYQLINRIHKSTSTSPGIQIVLEKSATCKCTRIIPGYLSFCPKPTEPATFTAVYDEAPKDTFASLCSGDSSLSVGGGGINEAFASVLKGAEQDVSKYETMHKALLKKALAEASESSENKERSMLTEATEDLHPDLKASYCRPCPGIKSGDDSTGSVFIDIFNDSKKPYQVNNMNNYAMIYVVSPKGSAFEKVEDFLDAVRKSAVNLMTAFCDFNGMVKRAKSNSAVAHKRINVIRICLFSGGSNIHSKAEKKDVALAILQGLSNGYHYGPSPRLNLAFDGDDVFQQVWNSHYNPNPPEAEAEVAPVAGA
eukprot:Selendium_serpulae@DN4986_c0_g1_i1.p1